MQTGLCRLDGISLALRKVASVELDGKMLPAGEIQLVEDRAVHNVRVVLGEVPVKEDSSVPQQATSLAVEGYCRSRHAGSVRSQGKTFSICQLAFLIFI